MKFHGPTNSEHKLHKARIKNWLPIEFKLGFPLLRICRHNHQLETLTGSPTTGNPKFNCWNCASITKSHSWYLYPIEQKLNTIRLIIYKYTTNTKFCYLLNNKTERKFPNPWGNTRKSWFHLPSLHSLNWQQKQKNKTLDSLGILILFSYNKNKKKELSPRKMRLTLVTNSWEIAFKSWMDRYSLRVPGFQPK